MKELRQHIRSMKEELRALHLVDVEPILELFFDHDRVVFCTMGKSAFACAKVVYTARSYGLEWYDLDVCHAFHGDAGIIKENDLLVLVSKSGNTPETIEVAKYFKSHTKLAVVSDPGSELAEECDYVLNIPVKTEGSPFGYAPMVSTTLYMIVLHGILCEVIEYIGLTVDDYARNHPSGDIGKRLQLDKKLSPKNAL